MCCMYWKAQHVQTIGVSLLNNFNGDVRCVSILNQQHRTSGRDIRKKEVKPLEIQPLGYPAIITAVKDNARNSSRSRLFGEYMRMCEQCIPGRPPRPR